MALANYTDLVSSISSWMHRDDLTSVIPDFVALAETRISTDLKIQDLEKSSTISTVAGQQDYSLPSDINTVVRMYLTDAEGIVTLLQGFDPTNYQYNSEQQKPIYYFIEANLLKVAPLPDTAYTITIIYKGNVPSLQTNSTNLVMTKYPNIYLHSCLVEAAVYIKDDARLQSSEMRYQQAIKTANTENYKKQDLLSTELGKMRSFDIRTM